jgi:hypothetical protein
MDGTIVQQFAPGSPHLAHSGLDNWAHPFITSQRATHHIPASTLAVRFHAGIRIAMTTERDHNPMLWSTIAIALLVALTAVAGILWSPTYARETLYQKAGGIGSDLVDLLLVVPVLLISGIKGYRGSVPARLVWLGTLGYLLYNFALYAFGVHFNALFLVYCATLSLCLYATVFSVPFIPLEQIAQTYIPRAPRKTVAIAFLVLALATAAFDLREVIPALLAGRVPQSAIQTNTPVNFVYALDLMFLLPALCIAAFLLFRRKASGYALAPALLALLAIMNMELAVLMVVMARMGCFGMSYPMIISFVVLGLGSAILLWFYFASARRAVHTDSKRSEPEFVRSL